MSSLSLPQAFSAVLSKDPYSQWDEFNLAVREAFASKGKAYFDYGMLHECATDLEWVAAGNAPVADNTTGDLVPIPRPTNERPANLTQNASSAAVAAHSREHVRYLAIREASAELKASLLLSIQDPSIISLIQQPPNGTMNITSMQIMTVLGARFGVPSAITLTRWDAETRLPIGQLSFTEYCASHRTLHANLARGQSPLSEFEKVRRIISGMSVRSDLVKAADAYKSLNPLVHNQNFEDLVEHVEIQEPNMTVHEGGYGASVIPTITMVEHEKLLALAVQRARKGTKQGGSGHPDGWRDEQRDSDRVRPKYCYVHGYDGHAGKNCRRMLGDPTSYPASKVEAKAHTDVVGGNAWRRPVQA